MSNIDFSQTVSAADIADRALVSAKAAATAEVVAAVEAAATAITGPIPEAEKASWPAKAEAARALIADTATVAQAAMIEAEARVTGEDTLSLAGTIVAKADAYATLAATLAGLRRHTLRAVAQADTPEAVAAAIADLQAALTD